MTKILQTSKFAGTFLSYFLEAAKAKGEDLALTVASFKSSNDGFDARFPGVSAMTSQDLSDTFFPTAITPVAQVISFAGSFQAPVAPVAVSNSPVNPAHYSLHLRDCK
jgi:hypothetical protein